MIDEKVHKINLGQAHLWYVSPDEYYDEESLDYFNNILSEEDKSQLKKFIFPKDRHLYLVAHAFLRTCLSKYADVKPEEWIFYRTDNGKPFTDYSINSLPLTFNLSHTAGMIVCIITLEHPAGVDVERIRPDKNMTGIAERFFAAEELQDIKALPAEEQHKRFYEYWTLKESFIKAKGDGLSIGLDSFYFIIDNNCPIRIFFRKDLQEDPGNWRFFNFMITENYICSVAVRSMNDPVELCIPQNNGALTFPVKTKHS